MSPKIEAISEEAPKFLKKLLLEAGDELEEALVAAVKEAQAQDSEAKLSIGFTTTVNLDKDQIDYQLGFSVRHKLTASSKLPDPDQPDLPGTTVTLKTEGMDPVTFTDKDLRRAGRVINSKA